MRKVVFAGLLFSSAALAQGAPSFRVQFVPPPELGAKANRPGPSAEGAYTLSAIVTGVNAQTKQPWTAAIPVRSYAVKPARGVPSGRRQYMAVRFTFHKSALSMNFGSAIARQDEIRSIKFDFHPVNAGTSTSVTLHELAHGSLEVVDEYVEAAFPTYQKLSWTWIDGQKPQTDEWTAPK